MKSGKQSGAARPTVQEPLRILPDLVKLELEL
jgi:hypothetical protein